MGPVRSMASRSMELSPRTPRHSQDVTHGGLSPGPGSHDTYQSMTPAILTTEYKGEMMRRTPRVSCGHAIGYERGADARQCETDQPPPDRPPRAHTPIARLTHAGTSHSAQFQHDDSPLDARDPRTRLYWWGQHSTSPDKDCQHPPDLRSHARTASFFGAILPHEIGSGHNTSR